MVRFVVIGIFLIVGAMQVNGQCSKDTDCKGDRICVKGECIDQKSIQATPAASQPATQSAAVTTQPESQSTPRASVPIATGALDLSKSTFEAGAALGVWFGGTVSIKVSGDGPGDVDQDASFMMRFYLDGYLMPKLAVGLVMYWAPSVTIEGNDYHAFEIAGSIRPRFLLSPKVAIKPSLEIGYRNSGADILTESLDGFAMGANADLQFAVAKNVLLFTSLGFHAQITGGKSDLDIDFTYAPIFYLLFGVGFGNF